MRILVFREIEPVDPKTCDERCAWRDGRMCDLFCTTLVPLSTAPREMRCRRSRDCKRAERQSVTIERRIAAERQMRVDRQETERAVNSPLINQGEGR